MSVRMRHTKGHTGNRRSHHALKEPQLSKCADCGLLHLMHRVCANCGKYRGRVVIDVEKQIVKKEEKAKRRRKEMEQSGIKSSTKEKDGDENKEKEVPKLEPDKLSKK